MSILSDLWKQGCAWLLLALSGARKYSRSRDPGGRRLETSGEHKICHSRNSYCWPSLGLGNTAGAETLEGDVWRALKSVTAFVERWF